MLSQCDLAVLSSGKVIKNSGLVDVVTLSFEIQNLLSLGSISEYDKQPNPVLYFLAVEEDRLGPILESLPTTRAIAQSTRTLYK